MSARTGKATSKLDPNAPGLDQATRERRRALAKMQQMSATELTQLAVRAGIYTKGGEAHRSLPERR